MMLGPKPLPDGLPGILYWQCNSCGYTRPVTHRVPRDRLNKKAR